MPKYLTIEQYKLADTGMNITNISDFTLARTIARAESDIDSFVGFDLKRGGFEPHSISFQSLFDEKTRKTPLPSYPVPIRQITRYRIQVSNLSTTGAGFFADISPSDCVINEEEGYVEIVPLQAVTYSLSPILIQLGLNPPIVQMDCIVGYYLTSFGETLIATDNTYMTYAAIRGSWETSTYNQALHTQPNQLPAIPPVIYVNGVSQTSGYTLNTIDGLVTFPSSMQSHTISADYTYNIPDDVRDACVDQVTYLLGLRALNQMGMQGSAFLHNGDVEIRTVESFPARFPQDNGALCDRAANKLKRYIPIPLA